MNKFSIGLRGLWIFFWTFSGFSSFWPCPGPQNCLPGLITFWPWQPFWRPCRPIFPSKATFWRLYRPIFPSKTTFWRLYMPNLPILLVLEDETCMTDPSTHMSNKTPQQFCCGSTLVIYIYIYIGRSPNSMKQQA